MALSDSFRQITCIGVRKLWLNCDYRKQLGSQCVHIGHTVLTATHLWETCTDTQHNNKKLFFIQLDLLHMYQRATQKNLSIRECNTSKIVSGISSLPKIYVIL